MISKGKLIIFLVTVLVSSGAFAQTVSINKTPKGIEFWHYHDKNAKRTAVSIKWKNNAPPNNVHMALSRLAVRLMVNGGAGGKSPEEIIADFEDIDGGSRLFVSPREISGFIVAPKEGMTSAAEIANLVLARPTLDAKWFAREKSLLVDKAKSRGSGSWGNAWNLAREIMLGDHRYKNFWSLVPAEQMSALSVEDAKRWHSNNFSLNDIKIAVAGNIDANEIGVAIDMALQDLPVATNTIPDILQEPNVPPKTIVLHKPELKKSVILLLGKIPNSSAGHNVSLNLATGVLGFGKQSRLFKSVRSGLRATYGFYARMNSFTRDHRILSMSGEVETALLQKALDEVEKTYVEFWRSGVGLIEFPFAKRYYKQRIEKELKKPSSVAFLMMKAQMDRRSIDDVPTLLSQIAALDRSTLNGLVKKIYPRFEDMLKIVVTPDKNIIENGCVITGISQWRNCIE